MLNKELLMMTSGEKASAKIAIQTYVSAHVILQNGEDIHLQGKPSVVKEATYNNRDVVYIECLRRGGVYVYSAINLKQDSVDLSLRFTIEDLQKESELILYSND